MLEEGSKPRRGRMAQAGPGSGLGPLIASPWLPTGGALAVTLALGAAVLAASAVWRFPLVGSALERNYWLVAAVSVLVVLGCGKDVQLGAARDLARARITGDVIVVLAGDCALIAAIIIGGCVEPLMIQVDAGYCVSPSTGIAAFFIATANIASALLGRRLMEGPRIADAQSSAPAAPATKTIEPGATIPFHGVVVAGRSEVDEGPIGGSPLGSLREAGDVVRRGARNGDGRLVIEPALEPPLLPPDYPPAPVFAAAFNARVTLMPAAMIALGAIIAFYGMHTGAQRIALALLGVALSSPAALSLVRPLLHANARRIAARYGWRLNGTAAVDALSDINALVLGRAGVMSRADLEIVAIHPALDVDPVELVATATSLAQGSQGVWAHTLLRYAVQRKMRLAPITDWIGEIHASGFALRAQTQGGQRLVAGPREWLEEQGIRTQFLEEKVHESLLPGRRSLWVAQLEPVPFLLGAIVAGERLKPGASEVCKNAKRFGLTGALLDRQDLAGGAELARYLNLRLVEDDALARKAMATEWDTLQLRPVIVQHRGDPAPEAPAGPRLLLGARFNQDAAAVAGGWTAATERGDPRLILDLLRLAHATRRRQTLGYLLVAVFCVPGLWTLATGQDSPAIMTLGAAVGVIGALGNAMILHLTPWTATDVDDER